MLFPVTLTVAGYNANVTLNAVNDNGLSFQVYALELFFTFIVIMVFYSGASVLMWRAKKNVSDV
jgi:hypothetical protein